MSEKKWKAGDVVELANKEGGFTDPETGLDISRDQKVELKEPIGTLTNEALVSGGLLIVSGKSAKARQRLMQLPKRKRSRNRPRPPRSAPAPEIVKKRR
jgi:hypothetical protein